MNFLLIDVETTGLLKAKKSELDDQPHITEFGAILATDKGDIIYAADQLIQPPIPIPEETIKINGVTDDLVKGMPTFEEYFDIIDCMFEDAHVLVAHNAPFDKGMIDVEYKRLCKIEKLDYPEHVVCTVQEYKAKMGKWPKLTELYKKVIGKELQQTHRALDDCRALHDILKKDKFYAKMRKALK